MPGGNSLEGGELTKAKVRALGKPSARRVEASWDMVARAYERLCQIAGIADEGNIEQEWDADGNAIGPSYSDQINALGQILRTAIKYFPQLKSFANVEERVMKSLEPGGPLYRRLIQLGWTPPAD